MTHYQKIANALVIPESILPLQFFQRGDTLSGESRLLLALIEITWFDLKKNFSNGSRCGRRIYKDALDWFLDDSVLAERYPFSFLNVAGYLNIEPGAIRKQVGEMHEAYCPTDKGPLAPLSRRRGTRKERKSWLARATNRRGYEVWVRWEKALYRLETFPTREQAEHYLYAIRGTVRAQTIGRVPTELLKEKDDEQNQ